MADEAYKLNQINEAIKNLANFYNNYETIDTKKFDPKMNEYFGIDAEKAFIEAQAKVKEKSIFSMTKEEKAAAMREAENEFQKKI